MNANINFNKIREIAESNHIIQESDGVTVCPVCYGELNHYIDPITERVTWYKLANNKTQKAHFLSNDKPNNKKFGKIIIEDSLNHTLVCSLECNNAIQLRNNPVEAQKILIDILTKHLARDLIIISKQLYSAWCNLGELIIDCKEYECKYNNLYVKFSEYETEKV